MENALTPEQQKQINSWVSQRDSILLDIANKKTENESLTVKNKELASSNTEISNKIQQSIGRLQELDRQEINRVTFVLRDVVKLDEDKSVLQTELVSLKEEINILEDKKKSLHDDIAVITKVHEAVFARSSDIERIVSETVRINSVNSLETKNILAEAGNELKKIIDIGSQNVAMTKNLVAEIPKMIVDIHRDVIERKKFNKHKI